MYEYLMEQNYSAEAAFKVINYFTKCNNEYPDEYLIKKYNDIYQYFKDDKMYSVDSVKKIIYTFPNVLTYSKSKLDLVYNVFLEYGFDNDNIEIILKNSPSLLGYDSDTILNKLQRLEEANLYPEEVMYMVIKFSDILTRDIDKTLEKINFLNNIGLHFVVVNKPKELMQSLEVTYARYMFFCSQDKYVVDIWTRLFMPKAQFESQFNVHQDTLLNMYPLEIEKSR